MRLRFKVQRYQTEAVDAVADCFAGQPRPGPAAAGANAEIALSPAQLLENIRAVQRARGLPLSGALARSAAPGSPDTPNLDVEMETGTGKTYVYIKTIMELHARYGWSRFIVVVPSVAIREGVRKTFEITGEHFQQAYGSKPRSFCYSSSRLHELERFASGAGVQVMIINIQAFNTASRDSRRIYEVLDELQSRRPADVIGAARPAVIIDEPQRIGAAKSLAALSRLSPLMVLRYSATHRVEHNRVHRLGALDAYQQQLVKRIAVRGITVRGLAGATAYLYLDATETTPGSAPRARIELEVRTASGIRRQVKRLRAGASLHLASGGIEAYRGLSLIGVDAGRDVVELSDGTVLAAGQATADVTEETRRRIQIREVIRAHLDKERQLFPLGIKVLSLFFVDEVAKYRDYRRPDTRGEYARCFGQEYDEQVGSLLAELAPGDAYRGYLEGISAESTHRGYFCVDRKSGRFTDGEVRKSGDERGQSADAGAYELILRDKERLLSFGEKTRFIFSHSALREGWDNPNVFVLGMLKKSDNTVSRRQEIGRGLRLCVNQRGERMDDPATVHEINQLTVVTDESYTDFVAGLQLETGGSAGDRCAGDGRSADSGRSAAGGQAGGGRRRGGRSSGAEWPDAYPVPADGRLREREGGSARPGESLLHLGGEDGTAGELAVFDSEELIRRCVRALDSRLRVGALEYLVQHGEQLAAGVSGVPGVPGAFGSRTDLAAGTSMQAAAASEPSRARYDLLGEVAGRTQLTRRTVASILGQVRPATFAGYRRNPERFIAECARLIGEQTSGVIAKRLG